MRYVQAAFEDDDLLPDRAERLGLDSGCVEWPFRRPALFRELAQESLQAYLMYPT